MNGDALERVLSRLEGVRKVPGGYVGRCPAHHDRTRRCR